LVGVAIVQGTPINSRLTLVNAAGNPCSYTGACMPRRRIFRLATVFLAVLSLLFSQLAMASHACPSMRDAAAMARMMAAGAYCDGMDDAQPALCHEHSISAAQAFESIKLPSPSLPMVVQVLELPLVLDAPHAIALPQAATPEARPPPDPLFLSTLRLRV
jgi:hypothetical protein